MIIQEKKLVLTAFQDYLWNFRTWYDMIWYDMIYDTIRYDTIWYDNASVITENNQS